MPEDAQERLQANLQGRLRKLICQGLGYLDLSDAGTASQLEPALSVMVLLIEGFKIRGQLEEARAAKQWLQGLLEAEVTTQAEAIQESSLTEGRVKRRGVLKTTKCGAYTPNPQIQENPVVRHTGKDEILTCNNCGIELRSPWVFDYLGKVHLLITDVGHNSCGGKYVPAVAKLSMKFPLSATMTKTWIFVRMEVNASSA
ncbi:unnamed protein product [Polarella glacialis]|uniref:Uncharacterized protein n=1 Tax=Polarella glacialis TaxID=89957 RepID=A0A813LLY7_POLGL|nr:unnamed protein product [Polarella glacialis]CAE8596346.1 unnamed protein product [Polarella glacialis]CAE8731958.1 unnamed protein product [Polarella glacialis]